MCRVGTCPVLRHGRPGALVDGIGKIAATFEPAVLDACREALFEDGLAELMKLRSR